MRGGTAAVTGGCTPEENEMTMSTGVARARTEPEAELTPPVVSSLGQVTVVVHTRNQRERIADVVTRVEALPGAAAGEIVFVDDSDDGTADVIRRVAEQVVIPVHLVHRRPWERSGGLASVVRAGIGAARCRHVCVIDCTEHAPEEIPALVEAAVRTRADLVVGGATSRFFLVRRSAVDVDRLRGRSSRVVREMVRRTPGLRVAEVSAARSGPAHRSAVVSRPVWRGGTPSPAR